MCVFLTALLHSYHAVRIYSFCWFVVLIVPLSKLILGKEMLIIIKRKLSSTSPEGLVDKLNAKTLQKQLNYFSFFWTMTLSESNNVFICIYVLRDALMMPLLNRADNPTGPKKKACLDRGSIHFIHAANNSLWFSFEKVWKTLRANCWLQTDQHKSYNHRLLFNNCLQTICNHIKEYFVGQCNEFLDVHQSWTEHKETCVNTHNHWQQIHWLHVTLQ